MKTILWKKFNKIIYKIKKKPETTTGLIMNEYIDFINKLQQYVDESKWIELTLVEDRWNLVQEFIEQNMENYMDCEKLLYCFEKSKLLANRISFIEARKSFRQDHSLVIAYNRLRNKVTSEEICTIHRKKFRTHPIMFNHLRSYHPDVYVGYKAESLPALESDNSF
ncbi:uncharacterized protein LOC113790297 [Dermatophagoides pteronyssinus]|uniref:uncharacterized protein LOC113790297 n=1 Tax=Dermatophagoides pteronyssinus TaxID=6956 RepID=UPI003F663848